MELTKRALGFLRRQYSLILKKNYLANALIVAGLSLALNSGAMLGVAHAADYTSGEDVTLASLSQGSSDKSTISGEAILTLTGDDDDHILLNAGTLINYGTLYLGVEGATYTSSFNGTLTATYDKKTTAPTTVVLSAVEFANKTTIANYQLLDSGAGLKIFPGWGYTVTMAGLDIGDISTGDTNSFLNIVSGTLELVAIDSLNDSSYTYTSYADSSSTDFNANIKKIIDGTITPDSDFDGELKMSDNTYLKISSGVLNMVDATLWENEDEDHSGTSTISGTISITGTGTVIAAFDDFVTASNDQSVEYTPLGNVAATSLSLCTSIAGSETASSKFELDSNTATLILDGEQDYINKEAFATLLNSDAWDKFIQDSTNTSTSTTLVIGYGSDASSTLDDTFTYDTSSGTITITNLNLTDYYSLSQFLANADTDGSYTINEAVISGALSNTTLTAASLLQGTSASSTIESTATLTLTGDTYTDEYGTTNSEHILLSAGTLTNEGTLNLGLSTASYDATLKGTLTTTSTSTTTILSDVLFTDTANIAGKLTVASTASITASGTDASVSIAADTLKDTSGNYTFGFTTYVDDGASLMLGTLPTGDSLTEYTYIKSKIGDGFDSMDLLYVSLASTLTMGTGTNLFIGASSSDASISGTSGLYFSSDSLFIADLYGIDASSPVISGGNTTLTVEAGSSLGLVNASEGTYIILADFTVSSTDTPWNADSVTIGNSLLAVESVSGTGTTDDPYKVTVSKSVDETLYAADGGGALADIMTSGEFTPSTSNALAQYIYTAAQEGGEAVPKAMANTASAGANSGSNVAGMTAVRSSAETFAVRNTVVHMGPSTVTNAGGTLLIKDANGKVTAEYNNVMEVAYGGTLSDAPAALGGTTSGIGNSIGVWAMPFYSHESISGAKVGSYQNDTHTDIYGVTIGIDKTFTPKGLDVLRLGLAFNIGAGETEGYGYTGSSESDFGFFGLATYGSMRKGALTISSSLSYTNTDGNFDSQGITGETDTDVWYGVLNAEYAFDMGSVEGSTFFSNVNMIPYSGIGLMSSKTDDYTTSLGSSVQSDRQNVFTFPVGLKFAKEFDLESGWTLKPEIGFGAIFASGDLYQRTSTGNTLGSSLDVIKSQVVDKTSLDLGFSFDIRKDNVGIFLDYGLQKSDIRTAHGVSAKFEYRF